MVSQVRRFMQEGHDELVILKISHLMFFDAAQFAELCALLTDETSGLGEYLFVGTLTSTQRLADIPIATFLQRQGCVLVVIDKEYDPPANSGLYRYRDWNASHPADGDLTVFDVFSNTPDFDEMVASTAPDPNVVSLPKGQLPKLNGPGPNGYLGFDGCCQTQPNISCDLFLLSWTLTPWTNVGFFSRAANQNLAGYVCDTKTNRFGKRINLLYTDYVEYSRSTDVAWLMNGLATVP